LLGCSEESAVDVNARAGTLLISAQSIQSIWMMVTAINGGVLNCGVESGCLG
jgi:hypothetical protein